MSSLIRRLVESIARRLPQPRVIYDVDGSTPYLSRYYLIGRPRMADGSDPFSPTGEPRPNAIYPRAGLGVYLHHFHRGDKDRELHNHPWLWSLALILAGGYVEERRQGDAVIKRTLGPGRINWISHDDYHRVELIDGDSWTLFIAGPKVSSWGFWDRDTGGFVHWREWIERRRGREVSGG